MKEEKELRNQDDESGTVQIPVACNRDCGAGCPLVAHVKDDRLIKITNSSLNAPYMTGCAIGFQMSRVVYAPDRLTKPLIHTGPRGSGTFKEASWEAALNLIAERLTEIKARHGSPSITHTIRSDRNRV